MYDAPALSDGRIWPIRKANNCGGDSLAFVHLPSSTRRLGLASRRWNQFSREHAGRLVSTEEGKR